jgi:hypothetical protein
VEHDSPSDEQVVFTAAAVVGRLSAGFAETVIMRMSETISVNECMSVSLCDQVQSVCVNVFSQLDCV